jgi:hypothetical protein
MDRFTYIIVGGVLALVVAGLSAAAIARGRETPPDLTTPSGVVLAYALAEQRGDGQAAWELLAPSAQARADHDRFVARAANNSADRAYLGTENERVTGDSASVVLVRTYPASGGLLSGNSYTRRSTVQLTHDAAGWRISVPDDDYLLTRSKP